MVSPSQPDLPATFHDGRLLGDAPPMKALALRSTKMATMLVAAAQKKPQPSAVLALGCSMLVDTLVADGGLTGDLHRTPLGRCQACFHRSPPI